MDFNLIKVIQKKGKYDALPSLILGSPKDTLNFLNLKIGGIAYKPQPIGFTFFNNNSQLMQASRSYI